MWARIGRSRLPTVEAVEAAGASLGVTVVSLIFAMLQVHAKPFRSEWTNWLQLVALVCLTLVSLLHMARSVLDTVGIDANSEQAGPLAGLVGGTDWVMLALLLPPLAVVLAVEAAALEAERKRERVYHECLLARPPKPFLLSDFYQLCNAWRAAAKEPAVLMAAVLDAAKWCLEAPSKLIDNATAAANMGAGAAASSDGAKRWDFAKRHLFPLPVWDDKMRAEYEMGEESLYERLKEAARERKRRLVEKQMKPVFERLKQGASSDPLFNARDERFQVNLWKKVCEEMRTTQLRPLVKLIKGFGEASNARSNHAGAELEAELAEELPGEPICDWTEVALKAAKTLSESTASFDRIVDAEVLPAVMQSRARLLYARFHSMLFGALETNTDSQTGGSPTDAAASSGADNSSAAHSVASEADAKAAAAAEVVVRINHEKSIKSLKRLAEKVAAYSNDPQVIGREGYPFCSKVGDTLRASVVVRSSDPAHILEVYERIKATFEVVRVKNNFASAYEELQRGHADLLDKKSAPNILLNFVLREPSSKKIQLIGEIQIRQQELLDASKDDHKLYEILRVDTMNEMLGRSRETAQWNIFQEEELGEERGADGDRGRGLLVGEPPKQVSQAQDMGSLNV
eukprot:g1417.t1